MPAIVKHYDKKTGKIRVYESTPRYDPATKQSRPKRKYPGTLDPETNELIPSPGRRGRSAASKNTATIINDSSSDRISTLEEIISKKDAVIKELQNRPAHAEALLGHDGTNTGTPASAFMGMKQSLIIPPMPIRIWRVWMMTTYRPSPLLIPKLCTIITPSTITRNTALRTLSAAGISKGTAGKTRTIHVINGPAV